MLPCENVLRTFAVTIHFHLGRANVIHMFPYNGPDVFSGNEKITSIVVVPYNADQSAAQT